MTEKLPKPDPSRFPDLQAKHLVKLPAGTVLGRISFTMGAHPAHWNTFRHYGPTTLRFDHHSLPKRDGQKRGIMYAAVRKVFLTPEEHARSPHPLLRTCLAEVFRDSGTIDTITDTPTFATFRLAEPLALLDLVDSDWITKAGGNAAISSGLRSRCREWSKAIYNHYGDALDGLYYASSNFPAARSVALYERAKPKLPAHPTLLQELSSARLAPELEVYADDLDCDLI
ncbi:RES domain-containing protein [Nocardioides sp. TF02-7]|uniref:RES domain-containing protein n=1 Tax=Nocardioides sp. TF02-7 TaxID=2917724 RepID=UPI001F070D4D|nr:RES domain-containing protein [Nocardioides sp. TF02-7]UMG91498.1 RES domain-containing protein [Nocardioides sp. TF02-7]